MSFWETVMAVLAAMFAWTFGPLIIAIILIGVCCVIIAIGQVATHNRRKKINEYYSDTTKEREDKV